MLRKDKRMRYFVSSVLVIHATLSMAQSAPLEVTVQKGSVAIAAGERPILRYQYAGVPFKPYAAEFYTPAGINVLRDAPHDHLHHHALMFAISTEDIDFWAETPECGKQIHLGTSDVFVRDDVAAGFVESLEWRNPKTPAVVLVERRTIEVSSSDENGASLLTWTTRLEVPPGTENVTLTGHHYHGLGMRFLQSMDPGGTFLYATNAEGEVVRGDEQLTPAAWCAYTANAEGKPVTAAMFDGPGNPRPALWFTMRTPFAYLSATINTWREPLTVKAGEPVTLRYGVALWDGEADAAKAGALYESWKASLGDQ